MDLNTLRLFVAAAHAGSLSEAARRTGVPLPTLSRRVRALEDELGVRLLERGARGLELTAAGTQLLADADGALETLSQAEKRLHDGSGVAGTLRVSVPPSLDPLWRVFSEFGRSYPAVRFDIFVTDRRVDLVADGIDVGVRVGEGGFVSYVGRTLTRYRHRVVASPQLLERNPVTEPEHLGGVPVACWRASGPASWTLGERVVAIRPWITTNDYRHLLELALAGEAVVEVPPYLARRSLDAGRLVSLLPDHPMPEQLVRAVVVERRAMSPLVRQFLDFLAAKAPGALGP